MSNSILKVYLDNFIHFDFSIFLLAIVNMYFLLKIINITKDINRKLYPKGYIAGGWENYNDMKNYYTKVMSINGEEELIALRKKMNFAYAVFENITGIFPLMGLLGTVVSLIPMVNSIGQVDTGLFFSALTSTFWGIVFAIISKAFNGYLESEITEAERGIQNLFDRYSTMVRKQDEEKKPNN